MYWLIQAYIEKFKFWGMVMVGMFLPGLIAVPVGRYLAKPFEIDDQLVIGACFFALLAAEVFAYDRLYRWWYFRNLKP
jgi:putative Ca2+/H+ antiporter (TMEM165/GDT1 family)